MAEKHIFCFWEPLDRMPAYLELCLETWQRHFPDYEIVKLDYSNIEEWLPPSVLDVNWVKRYGIAAQTDAFRVSLLATHGGIWFDVDSVVSSDRIYEFFDGVDKLTMFGAHMGCMSAPKDDPFAVMWYRCILKRIEYHKWYRRTRPLYVQVYQFIRRAHRFGPGPVLFRRWDYMGNAALKNISVLNKNKFCSLDRVAAKVMPEVIAFPHADGRKAYDDFYFNPDFNDRVIEEVSQGCGLVMLHNSWSPKWIKSLSRDEVLGLNIPISRLLSDALA